MHFSSTLFLVVQLVYSLPVIDTVPSSTTSPSQGPQKSILELIQQSRQRQAQFIKERETNPNLASNPGLFDWIGLDQQQRALVENKPQAVIPSMQDPNFHPSFSESEQPAWKLETSEAASAGKSSASSATAIVEKAVNLLERVIPKK